MMLGILAPLPVLDAPELTPELEELDALIEEARRRARRRRRGYGLVGLLVGGALVVAFAFGGGRDGSGPGSGASGGSPGRTPLQPAGRQPEGGGRTISGFGMSAKLPP